MNIEDHLGHALREAADAYELEAQPLLERGHSRGLRLRRRRRITRAAGAALAVALVGTGVVYGVGAQRNPEAASSPVGPPSSGTSAAHPGSGPAMSGREILDLLESLMPAGRITEEQAIGAGGGRPVIEPASASLVLDDGQGGARIQFGSAPVDSKDVLAPDTCPTPAPPKTHLMACSETRLPDGSVVSVSENTFNGKTGKAGTLQWTGTIVTPAGDRIWLDEYNYAPEGFPSSGTRPAPPLTHSQLAAVVSDKGWQRLFAAIRSAGPDHQLTEAQVFATATGMLPAGMTARSIGSDQEGNASLQLDSRRGFLDVTAQRWPGTARSEIAAKYYQHAQKLPDGTLLRIDQQKDLVRVYALHPDGMSVQLMTSGDLTPNHDSPMPLTVGQLKAIALDSTWNS